MSNELENSDHNVLHLDCLSGIAGDMTLASLIECGLDFSWLQSQLSKLDLGPFEVIQTKELRCGFAVTGFQVKFPHQHVHRHFSDILEILHKADLAQEVQDLAIRIFRRLAEAEAKVHGTTLEKVHFHEVGAVDSIVDIVGFSLAVWKLNIQRITFSNLVTGFGKVKIAHGLVSVPAPATTELLRGFQVEAGEVEGELVTPTGAAILAETAIQLDGIPQMEISASGFGAGTKEFPNHANVLKATIGKKVEPKKKTFSLTH